MQNKLHIQIDRKEDCCGCKSCEQICPKHCIKMQEDFEGFWYPNVDESMCIGCGLCIKHCPLKNEKPINEKLPIPKVFAANIKDISVLKNSSSGGAFSAFALDVLKNNGIVFGCAFDAHFSAKHIPIFAEEDLCKLQGSKYVASDLNTSYKLAKDYLQEDRLVLFSGSGCHIAGLKAYLGKEYEKLITLEILCHGTPSQKLFKKHLDYLGEKYREKIESYSFRDKSSGWGLNCKQTTKTQTILCSADKDPYYASFLRGKTYRPSCYECCYAKQNRIADITIGDFWGVELFHPEFYDKKGVSCVILNTPKGLGIWKEISEYVNAVESSLEKVSLKNHNLNAPTYKPKCRDFIYQGIDEIPYSQFVQRLKLHGKEAFLSFVKNLLPKAVRLSVNKIRYRLIGRT